MPSTAPIFNQRKRKTNWDKWQQRKGNDRQRGYGTEWRKLRNRIRERDKNLCQVCLRYGRLTEASAVDHIVPKSQGGDDTESNLQAICDPCHKVKTASERSNKRGGAV